MRETKHIVNVLDHEPNVHAERLVVFDTALRESHARAWHGVAEVAFQFLHLGLTLGIAHNERIGLGRHVAAAERAELVGERGCFNFLEVESEDGAVRLLRNRLDFLKQIPRCLRKLKVCLCQNAFLDHPGDKRIPARSIKRAILVESGPPTTKKQLLLVAVVTRVHERTKHLGFADSAVGVAKRVVKFLGFDLAFRQNDLL